MLLFLKVKIWLSIQRKLAITSYKLFWNLITTTGFPGMLTWISLVPDISALPESSSDQITMAEGMQFLREFLAPSLAPVKPMTQNPRVSCSAFEGSIRPEGLSSCARWWSHRQGPVLDIYLDKRPKPQRAQMFSCLCPFFKWTVFFLMMYRRALFVKASECYIHYNVFLFPVHNFGYSVFRQQDL